MEAAKSYILSVIASAIFVTAIMALIGKSSSFYKILRLMCGLFMTLVLVLPLVRSKIVIPSYYLEDVYKEADWITANAQAEVQQQICNVIKEQTEAYILEKASALNADITVSVKLALDTQYPTPESVHIKGNISPYARRLLSQTIQDDLGIASEDQVWSS